MENLDVREALFNDRRTGLIHEIQLPRERITTLHGIMWDIDPKILRPKNRIFPPDTEPECFYAGIKPVLGRHPLARFAEVRASGSGLHLILWMQPAVELRREADQQFWDHIVRAVQRSLPCDPNMPGITAVTRAVASVNSKNKAKVRRLKDGEPVEPSYVKEFIERFAKAPFRTVATILLGEERVSPCPICLRDDSWLDILDGIGKCYSNCGRVNGSYLLDLIYRPAGSKKPAAKPTQRAKKLRQKSSRSTKGMGLARAR